MLHEDNTTVGRVFAHPKAALADKPAQRPVTGIVARMLFAALLGVFFGLLLSVVFAPGFAAAFAIGGAMSFAAGTVVLVLMRPNQDQAQHAANSRTDEEVRQALADTKGRDK